MGATPAKQFPQPGSYAMDDQNVVAPQDPTPIIPQQQFVSLDSYSGTGTGAPAAPVSPIRRQGGGGNKKFFGDEGLDGIGYRPMIKLPTRKPIIPQPPIQNPIDPYTGK